MVLDDAIRSDLAAFLSRRFAAADVRAHLAAAAGLAVDGLPSDPRLAWDILLARAVAADCVLALVDAALDAHPADRNLTELRRLLTPRAKPRAGLSGIAAVVPLVALIVVLILYLVFGTGAARLE